MERCLLCVQLNLGRRTRGSRRCFSTSRTLGGSVCGTTRWPLILRLELLNNANPDVIHAWRQHNFRFSSNGCMLELLDTCRNSGQTEMQVGRQVCGTLTVNTVPWPVFVYPCHSVSYRVTCVCSINQSEYLKWILRLFHCRLIVWCFFCGRRLGN